MHGICIGKVKKLVFKKQFLIIKEKPPFTLKFIRQKKIEDISKWSNHQIWKLEKNLRCVNFDECKKNGKPVINKNRTKLLKNFKNLRYNNESRKRKKKKERKRERKRERERENAKENSWWLNYSLIPIVVRPSIVYHALTFKNFDKITMPKNLKRVIIDLK